MKIAVAGALAAAVFSTSAFAMDKADKVTTVLMFQRPCKLWLNEPKLKKMRMDLIAEQQQGGMDGAIFAGMHDQGVAATFNLVGEYLERNKPADALAADCKMAQEYAKGLGLMK